MTSSVALARPRRVPARRPGNFHLLAQMKVTKAKGLNTDLCRGRGCILSRFVRHRIPSACFLADPSSLRDFIGRKALVRREVDADHRRVQVSGVARYQVRSIRDTVLTVVHSAAEFARSGARSATECARSRAHSSDRSRFEPPERDAAKAASHAKRKRFSPLGRSESRALTQQMSGQMCIQALCFGDFHLCQQMKVTRPPGRDPATDGLNRPAARSQKTQSRETSTCFD